MFIAALFTIANCRMYKKMLYICPLELFNHKKNEITTFATSWIELKAMMLNEISQAQKDKYCTISIIWSN
jgi:hypothetical protein